MISFSMKDNLTRDENGVVVEHIFSIGNDISTEYRVIPVTQFEVVGYGE